MWARLRRFDVFYVLLFFVALILLRQFFSVDYIYGHDSLYHLSSIEAIRNAFSNGQFNLDLLPMVAYGFGYGSGMFYAQFFHIVAAILSFLVGDVVLAAKITHFVTFFLSGAVMYLLLKKVLGRSLACDTKNIGEQNALSMRMRLAAFLGACFYLSAPFHLTDHLVRDAEAELLIFLFIPLVILGLVYLRDAVAFHKRTPERNGLLRRFYFCFIIGYAGLLISNSAIAIFFTIFLGIAILVEILCAIFRRRAHAHKSDVKEMVKPLLAAAVLVALIVAPFYINLIQQRTADLVVFSEQTTANNHYYLENEAASFDDLFVPSIDSSYLNIPLTLNVCMVILAIYASAKYFRARLLLKHDPDMGVSISTSGEHFSTDAASISIFRPMLIVAILALFTTSALFPWGTIPDILSPLQFPWRLETILLPTLTILSAFGLYELFELFNPQALPFSRSRNLLPIAFMSVFALVSCGYYAALVQHDFELSYDATKYDAAYYGLGWGHEYLPERANRTIAGAISNSGTPSGEMALGQRGGGVMTKNDIIATLTKNETLSLEATISGATTIELPRLYYLGYEIEFTSASGVTTKLDYSQSASGLVEAEVPSAGVLRANYCGTTVVQVLKVVSGATVVGLMIYLLASRRKITPR